MKKKNIYLRALLIYCLVLAIIIAAGLVVLNRFLVSYEASRPDNAVEDFMSENGRDYWLSGLQELIDRGFSEFTLPSAAPEDFGLDKDGEITWISSGGDELTKYYDVRLGSSKICTLTLTQGEGVGFALTSWNVTGEEFRIPGGSDITISVPTGCTATINGVEVGSEYISGVGSIGVSLEHSFDALPASDIYTVENMLGPADIKAYSIGGEELEPNIISATEVEFFPEPSESFCFYTLPDAQVTVNGVDISGQYCAPIGASLDSGVEILRYECSGLYAAPQISVTGSGVSPVPAALSIGSCFIPGASAQIDGDMADFLEGFIHAYVDFSANKNQAASANFAVLAQYLLRDSELYTLTANTIENISWATTSGLKYNSIDYYDLIPLSGGRYVCSIYYDISYTLGVSDLDVRTGNVILIEEHDGKYYVSAMSAGL